MRRLISLLSITTTIALHAQIIAEEQFDYTPGSQLQSNGWFSHSASTTNPILVDSTGLSFSQTSYLGSGVGFSAYLGNNGSDENLPFDQSIDSNSVFAYFLLNVPDPVTSSGYFFHFLEYSNPTSPVYTSVNSTYRGRTFIMPGSNPSTQFKLGLSFNANSISPGDTTKNLNIGSTYLVVVRYTFVPGGSANDNVSLYLFEDGDDINTQTFPDIGPLTGTSSDLQSAQGIALRQFSSSQSISIDGIIATTSWLFNPPCPSSDLCPYTIQMTDSYGDGWNGNTIAFYQNGVNMGEVGADYVNQYWTFNWTDTIYLCDNLPVTVKPGVYGLWTEEIGFEILDPYGNTKGQRSPGTAYTDSTILSSFNSNCLTPSCPIVDTINVTSQTTCGTSEVTFFANSSNPFNDVVWLDSAYTIRGKGGSFTTPVLSGNATYYAAAYAKNNLTFSQHVGAPSTLPGGYGNYTNGMWFSVQNALTIDSITVISNGNVDFQVLISEGGGNKQSGHSGALLQRSDTVIIGSAGTHQVPVNITLSPGDYYINLDFLSSTTGQLFRSTSGANYPYAINSLISIDSVQFGTTGSNDRIYYAFDWVVSPGCLGNLNPAMAMYAPLPSNNIPFFEDFDNGIPCTWYSSPGNPMWDSVTLASSYNAPNGGSLNGTRFVIVNDDAAGYYAPQVSAIIESPTIEAVGYDTLYLEFDHYFRAYSVSIGFVEVFDGDAWVKIDSISTNTGVWSSPAHASYDITPYQNANLQVRLRYEDYGAWCWHWAMDNFLIDGIKSPCVDVRIEVQTDIYGSETSWYIKEINTGIQYASGGPYADVSPYDPIIATHVDTICLPYSGTYEFRINDSYGDGLDDGTNAGWYQVDLLCVNGPINITTIDTNLTSINGAPWGAFHFGSTSNPPMYDSTVFGINCTQYSNIKFQVDMNKVTQGFTTPEVNGTWNNWCGNCNAMSDPDGDNIWEVTIPLVAGDTIEYKFSADSWGIQETNDPSSPCTNGNTTYTNRVFVVPYNNLVMPVVCWSSCDACSIEVTLNVNMAWEVANNAIDSNGVHVAGSFQGWSPSTTEMTDPDGDGIYSVTFESPLNEDLFYKFINGNDWAMAEASGDLAACGVSDGFGGYNRASSVGNADTIFDPVCFTKCYDCAVSIDEALGTISLFPNPTTGAFTLERTELAGDIEVTVIGLQGQLLRATEWTAGQSELNIDLSDLAAGVYMVRLTAKEGTRTLRVAVQR